MFLNELTNGAVFRVKHVKLAKEVGKKLADMGFTNGVEGVVVRSALLGDPIQIRILGYHVSIRKVEAAGIEVDKISAQMLFPTESEER